MDRKYMLEDPVRLWGIDLRYLLTDLMVRPPQRVWTVAELVADLTNAGFDLGDRPSKHVSDVLRAEIARSRVRRVGWGRYEGVYIPGGTRRRIRARAMLRRDLLLRSRV